MAVEKSQKNKSLESSDYSEFPVRAFIFSYDGPYGDYFQELIAKNNEIFSGTGAEIVPGDSGEVSADLINRLGIITTKCNDSNLKSVDLWPITPAQSEYLFEKGKLPHSQEYWEDLALILYDKSIKGENPKEAQAIYESLKEHRQDLELSPSDLEQRLIIVNAGLEKDQDMVLGVKPVIIPEVTIVYPHEILTKTGEGESPEHCGTLDKVLEGIEQKYKFEYGLHRGLPLFSQTGKGNRTLYVPRGYNKGLRIMTRSRDLSINTPCSSLISKDGNGRMNFASQKILVR